MIEGNVVWRTPKDATTSSAEKQGLDYVYSNNAESETKGSGITPQSISSAGKDTQSSNNEQGSSVKNAESDAIPTDEEVGFTQSNSVLQGEEVDNSRGDNESQEQGTAVQAGSKGEVENGLVHQGAQGGVENTKQPLFEYFKGGIKSLIEESKKTRQWTC